MNNLQIAARSLLKGKRNNIVKIISLGAGLAVGLILISKVLYEQSYDSFYPDAERIYITEYQWGTDSDQELRSRSYTPGGVAAGLREEIPGVQSATLSTIIARDVSIYTKDRKRLKGDVYMADSSFFDVVPSPMIAGDPKQTLARPFYVLVSESFAGMMDGDPVGQTIEMENHPGMTLTVGGVFEDYPRNSSFYDYDVILSFETCEAIWNWDPRSYWYGNDRYRTLFKLRPGVDPVSLTPHINAMRQKHVPDEMLEQAGLKIEFAASPLIDFYRSQDEVKRSNLLLLIIALALIAAAVLNYILIVISTLAARAKEIAVYKCYGAQNRNISALIFTETALHLLLSLILAALLITVFQGTVEELLAADVLSMLTAKTIAVLCGICLLVLLLAGYLPSRMFAGVPVASVFRNFGGGNKKLWKLALLFVQFTGAAFLFIMVAMIGRQYKLMIDDNPGYQYENVVYYDAGTSDSLARATALANLAAMPHVELAATGNETFWNSSISGNMISLPGEDRELFNVRDLYYANPEYIELFGLEIIDGLPFDPQNVSGEEMIVSRAFADKIVNLTGWQDGVVGKTVMVSEHGSTTITGVFENIQLGSIVNSYDQAAVLFYSDRPRATIFARLREVTGENILETTNALQSAFPGKEVVLRVAKEDIVANYNDARLFRDSVTIGSIVTLIIVLMGLIGYLRNEIGRRRAEIAIRKVNGAQASDILGLFSLDIIRIAVPAMIIGAISAYFAVQKWMEEFAVKATMPWWLYCLCAAVILAIIMCVILINCLRIANRNPVDSLKSE